MKQKMSISVDEDIVIEIEEKVKTGVYRNKSHLIELAIKKLMEAENGIGN